MFQLYLFSGTLYTFTFLDLAEKHNLSISVTFCEYDAKIQEYQAKTHTNNFINFFITFLQVKQIVDIF